MKKVILSIIFVSLLTACGGAADNADTASVSETSLVQESMTEESVTEESTASESEAAPENGEKPEPPQERKMPDNMYRVTAVDGNTITCEKVMGGRGFGGGFRGRMPEKGELPEGERPEMPENGEFPEGGRPDMPENGRSPEGERPQPETVTITITDSTELEGEIKAGDMITAELNEDNSAVSVKIADMPAAPEKPEKAESETSTAESETE